ncbi:MAG: NAD-dependent epimerase/dehydratase family protein [Lachnospiraceae bacterium]
MKMQLYHIPQYRKDLACTYDSVISLEKLRGSSILVTGATGLVGSYIVDFLLYCNEIHGFACEIYAACRNEMKFKKRFLGEDDEKPQLHFWAYDLDQPVTSKVRVDYVIHAAGNAYPAAFMKEPVKTLTQSVDGTSELLFYCNQNEVTRFLLVSSGEVYGKTLDHIKEFKEDESGYIDSMQLRSCYPLGKRAAENLCVSFQKQYGLQTIIVRLCHTYGPTASTEDNRVSQTFVRDVLDGRDIKMTSKGEQMRSWCYVADAVSGILTALLCGDSGQAYNVGTPISIGTIRELAEIVAKLGGRNVQFQLPKQEEKSRFNPMELAVLSSEKLEALGWHGRYSLEEGLCSVLECGTWEKRHG